MAISIKSRKAKSRSLQNKCAADILKTLQILYPDIDMNDVKATPMNISGIDVQLSGRARNAYPWAIECKNQEKINIWDAIKQADGHAKVEHLKPMVVFKRNREKPKVVIDWEDWIEFQKKHLEMIKIINSIKNL